MKKKLLFSILLLHLYCQVLYAKPYEKSMIVVEHIGKKTGITLPQCLLKSISLFILGKNFYPIIIRTHSYSQVVFKILSTSIRQGESPLYWVFSDSLLCWDLVPFEQKACKVELQRDFFLVDEEIHTLSFFFRDNLVNFFTPKDSLPKNDLAKNKASIPKGYHYTGIFEVSEDVYKSCYPSFVYESDIFWLNKTTDLNDET